MDFQKQYEDLYRYELERRDKIESKLSQVWVIIAFVGGCIASFIPKVINLPNMSVTGVIYVMICVLILLFVKSIVFTYKFYAPKRYRVIQTWSIIDDYKKELESQLEHNHQRVEVEIEKYYITELKEARDENLLINEKRMNNFNSLCKDLCLEIPLAMSIYVILSFV